MKVVFCVPTTGAKPYPEFVAALRESIPVLDAAGIDHSIVQKAGCPYISHARATMLRQSLDAKADVIVFLDHDVSWAPEDLLTLIQTDGDVVSGTYRFKKDEEQYMGALVDSAEHRPVVREDGAIEAEWVPAGFLKVTKEAIATFMKGYPHLVYGPPYNPSVDLFNHGAHNGLWWGEDYAFSRNWRALGERIWIVPSLRINHHSQDGVSYDGNFRKFLLRQPGGSDYKEIEDDRRDG